MAFGPGLTVETALFTKITAAQARRPDAGQERPGLTRAETALA
jgi:hypothetical protein